MQREILVRAVLDGPGNHGLSPGSLTFQLCALGQDHFHSGRWVEGQGKLQGSGMRQALKGKKHLCLTLRSTYYDTNINRADEPVGIRNKP